MACCPRHGTVRRLGWTGSPEAPAFEVSSKFVQTRYDSNNSNNSNDAKMPRYTKAVYSHVAHFGDSRKPGEAISGQSLELNTVECTGKGSSFWLSLRLS